ncbi:MAG: MFS transporter [Bacteroidetes bacterium]|nr:MAG: MFS transporter [Bacteroidota bacterium]REK00704.1 MAG: MFS transporter [Bacteroidota bacterium]REK35174.1 MAG: MFS transporter [Bacteroidota bacterium]REK48251.1 MAG: MFS transporter [Bacteroidota bacterium]
MQRILSLYYSAFSNLQSRIWILSLAMFVNRSGSMVLLFTSLYLTNELKFSISQAGLVMSFYGVGSIIGSYLGGWYTDKKDHRVVMIFSLIACALILLLMLVVKSLWIITAVVFTYALMADMFRPAMSAAIVEYSKPENRTRSVSLMRLANNMGFTIGPAIGGFIALHLGYKWLFILDAASSFAAGIMLIFFFKAKAITNESIKKKVKPPPESSAYRDKHYLLFILMTAVYGACFFQLFAGMPQYFNIVCKYSEDTIGLLLGLNGLLVVLVEMPLMAHLERRKKIFPFIVSGVFLLPIAFAFLLFGKQMIIFSVIYTIVITASEILALPFMMNHAISRPIKERQGQYAALYSIAFGISITAAPYFGLGVADSFGFPTLFVLLMLVSLLLGVGFWRLGKTQNKSDHPVSENIPQ